MPRSDSDPSGRGRWRVRTGLCAVVAASVVVLSSSAPGAPGPAAPVAPARAAPERPGSSASPAPGPGRSHPPRSFVLLQMNLCNSGMALSCYSSGRAVDEAVTKIRKYAPDLVTFQEVCRNDFYARHGWGKLAQAMADRYGSDHLFVSFVPARNRYTRKPYRCVNGEQFGVALIHHGGDQHRQYGWYGSQDLSDETRAWTCATVVEGTLTGCTTHLSTDPNVAMWQCKELISRLTSPWVMPEVVIAGDLNLRYQPGQPHNVLDCATPNYANKNDGWLQQVFFSRGLRWVEGRFEPMKWTDHPMLYERFQL